MFQQQYGRYWLSVGSACLQPRQMFEVQSLRVIEIRQQPLGFLRRVIMLLQPSDELALPLKLPLARPDMPLGHLQLGFIHPHWVGPGFAAGACKRLLHPRGQV